jgi:OmcA/MtrC family decaheme c-type cytochrome
MHARAGEFVRGGLIGRILVLLLLVAGASTGRDAAAVDDPGTSVETCIACHATGGVAQASDIDDPADVHYVDLDPQGPQTPSGYRRLQIDVDQVDLSGSRVVIDFSVEDETGAAVEDLFATDGEFTIAKLAAGALQGDPTQWQNPLPALERAEPFSKPGGIFQSFGGGTYRYQSVFDPSTLPVVAGASYRVAVRMWFPDLPAGNGWCDFNAPTSPVGCNGPVSLTRDIVQTAVCNDCHGVTSDTMLTAHGGNTDVEYCVTCHNPAQGDSDFTNMVHKIHYGANLTNGFPPYSNVMFTKDIDDCEVCHSGGGANENNWSSVPNRTACGSCHDDVNFDTGANHGLGSVQLTNKNCTGCHPATGSVSAYVKPIKVVHKGAARNAEAARYRGGQNGFAIGVGYNPALDRLTIDYSVTRDGAKVILQSDAAFAAGASLWVRLTWSTEEYTNTASGSTPAQPVSFNARNVGGVVSDLGGGNYRIVTARPPGAFGTLTAALEGRAVADLLSDGNKSEIPIQDEVAYVYLEQRGEGGARRQVVDVAKCNLCHDTAGAGITVHANIRSSQISSCVSCHNPNATDISFRPANPATTPDGKKEEAIDFKRMIHQIHSGVELANGLVIYGFDGPSDFSDVFFTGNRRNCLTCHYEDTYSTEKAWVTLPTTVDTGPSLAAATDDLNISQTAAACSSCHDDDLAKGHMLLKGASYMALDEDISQPGLPETIPLPEAGQGLMLLAGCAGLGALHRLRRRRDR